MVKRSATLLTALAAGLVSAGAALAAKPIDWQMWHQPAGSEMMARIEWFDEYTFYFITPITLFVLGLLVYVGYRFRASANPNPSKTSHNSVIEAVWTVVPILILVAIALPSFDLLNRQFNPGEEPTVTVKATGYQWYWGFEYQDESGVSFDSLLLREASEREAAGKTDLEIYPRLLAVDNELVVPVNEMVRVLVTAADVIHNFAMPAFGLKMDAIPGRLNETWFKAEREGLYFGQCSELCGRDHAYMPISIRVVSRAQYDAWQKAAGADLDSANKLLKAEIESEAVKLANNTNKQKN